MRIPEQTETVLLVEGDSDRVAVLAVARKLGRDLAGEAVAVVSLGGATNIEAAIADLQRSAVAPTLVGLCDVNERRYFDRVLPAESIFVCDVDLEAELIRAIGLDNIEDFIESQDELKAFRTFQKQLAQRERSLDAHVHRFCGIRAGRKVRYAEAMVDWLSVESVPEPLLALLDAV